MPRSLDSPGSVSDALSKVGDLLAAEGHSFAIAIIGGSALLLSGSTRRATTDVDIVGMRVRKGRRLVVEQPMDPLPEPLLKAAGIVARELNLAPDWLNAGPGSIWRTGPPSGMEGRIRWTRYGGLSVGLVHRRDLIFLKLDAAVWAVGPDDKHYQDLVGLAPTEQELSAAEVWVRAQDAGVETQPQITRIVQNVRKALAQSAR